MDTDLEPGIKLYAEAIALACQQALSVDSLVPDIRATPNVTITFNVRGWQAIFCLTEADVALILASGAERLQLLAQEQAEKLLDTLKHG